MKLFRRIALLAAAQIVLISGAFAEAPLWKMVPAESSLTFIATQNGAPAKGEFKKFTGVINFDFDQLQDNQVKIVVDMNSLQTSYADLGVTLKMPEWFDIKAFPEAVFEASSFTKTGEKTYEAKGTLTIRDKSQPVTLTFTVDQPTSKRVLIKGFTTLKRTAFGVGQGEWASVDEVQDDVRVDFTVSAIK